MKTRNGFVSNSSSSSFIIVYKGSKPCSHCGRSDHDLKDAIEQASMVNCDDNELYADGLDGVVKFLNEKWGVEDERDNVVKELKSVPKDMHVIYFRISMHNVMLNDLIENIEKSKSGQIIWHDGG